jgi:hypothetical protein
MKKCIFVVLVIVVLLGFFSALVSAQGTDATEIPEGFVFYHYQDEYLDFSFLLSIRRSGLISLPGKRE